jgi:phage terminase large subunit-like protein
MMSDDPACGFRHDKFSCQHVGAHRCQPRVLRVLAFFTELLQHTKGDYAGKPFIPTYWQRERILAPLFGDVVYDPERGRYIRQHRTLYLSIARRNGKSELLAAMCLYLLCGDGEEGAEVFGMARDKDQASIVYRIAVQMVRRSPDLYRTLNLLPSVGRIVDERKGRLFAILAGDAQGSLGLNASGAYIDELLSQPDRDLYDAVRTSMGNRAQPLLLLATTAESDPEGFAASERAWSARVAADPALEPERLVVMYTTNPDDDWTDPEVWKQSNPAMDDFLSRADLEAECRHAQSNPVAERSFRQFRLNQPVRAVGRAIGLTTWDGSTGATTYRELPAALAGHWCGVGLDLASTSDLAAFSLVFPDDAGGYDVIWRHFMPESQVGDLNRRTGRRADAWIQAGLITVTPGNVIDYDAIVHALRADRDRYKIEAVAFDRWGATQLQSQLLDEGWPMIAFGQGFSAMSSSTKELLRLVGSGRFRHGGNPLMRWQAEHVVTRTDASGNIKFDKGRSADKVDGIVAAVMALDVAIRRPQVEDYATVGFS